MNLLAPFGFYGWGNIGDDATLQGFARLIATMPGHHRVWVASRDTRHTAIAEPSFRYFDAEHRGWVHGWARFRSAAVVVPGGTPIMDTHGPWPLAELGPLIAKTRSDGKPIVFIGAGTEPLERHESRRIFQRDIAPHASYWTVRSECDEARLKDYGVSAERISVAADMAWLLDPVSPALGERLLDGLGISTRAFLIGVNLVTQKPVGQRFPALLPSIAAALDQLIEKHDATLLFFSNDIKETSGFDRWTSLRTIAAMKYPWRTFLIPNEYYPPSTIMSLLATCQFTISMRYHFCLFSALQRVPFIALQRSSKIEDLCSDLDWRFGCGLQDFCAERLSGLATEVSDQRPALATRLRQLTTELTERARRNVRALESLAIR